MNFDREDFVSFIAKCLNTLDTQTVFLNNWHIDLMCKYLMEVYKGEIRRLIINIPPRSLKSICINVAFPAWVLGKEPSSKIISASYSQTLSLKHSTDCRKIMNSDWYKKIFKTRISPGENEKRKFVTNQNGYRFATSVGGTLTGEGGDFIIVDDPQNPAKIHSKKEQEKVINWFESVLMSRLNNKKLGRIVIVMQRLHEKDLTGYLISKQNSNWNLLSLPSIAETDGFCVFKGRVFNHRPSGKILQSSREDKDYILNSMAEMGNFNFASQYQQNPIIKSGLIDKKWFCEFENEPKFEEIYYSIDTAVSIKEDSDFTAIIKFGVFENSYYILDIVNKRMDYVQIKSHILNLAAENVIFLIENKNVGSSLISDLKLKTKSTVVPIMPIKDKTSRVFDVINIIESRRVFVKKGAPFSKDFLDQVSNFPHAAHDDQVDALTQFLNHIKTKKERKREAKLRFI